MFSRLFVLQCPSQIPVKVCIYTLHVCKRDLLPQYHLVESADEKGIQEAPMEDCQPNYSSNEFEVIEMLGIDARVGVDLQSVVVVSRIFKQAVKRVKHFVRQKKEELPAKLLAKLFCSLFWLNLL